MMTLNHNPFKINFLATFIAFFLLQNGYGQACGTCAAPTCSAVKFYATKPAAQAGVGKVLKTYSPNLTTATGIFTTYVTIRTDVNGQVAVMQEIQIMGPQAGIQAQIQQILASRTYKLFDMSDAACATPLPANIANDGCSGTFNPGWTNLQPNTDYKLALTTNLGLLSGSYVYQMFNFRYYHGVRPNSTFTFNCGAAAATGNFFANGVTGQNGTLTVPITGATSGYASFTISGGGFSGFASINVASGQTSVSVPITYDGSGSAGAHSISVTSGTGTGSCTPSINVKSLMATFGFNCASANVTGSFTANNTGGQNGTLTIPLNNATAGAATFSVSGGGFTGTLSTTLTAAQATVSIPVTYDGTGAAGNHSITVASPQGTGSCGLNVNVAAAGGTFTFNCGSAAVTGNFIANNIANQGGFVTIPMTGATAGTVTFAVASGGFAGTLTTTLVANQAAVTIPITYDGSGAAGARAMNVTSSQGSGSCSPSATITAPSLAGAITFNCAGNITPVGSFTANGAGNQTGLINLAFTTQTPGEVSFSVSGNGFTGSLTTTIAAGQKSVTILVTYDGTGTAGNHSVTVTSAQASGSCSMNVPVDAIFSFNCGVYHTASNFVANGTAQNGTLVIPISDCGSGSATFTVAGGGFTGSLTTVLRDSQQYVAIPVAYDGSGAAGNHPTTITAAQGTGTCSASVKVKDAGMKGCDYIKGQSISFNIHSNNTKPGFSTTYILVDTAGVIQYSVTNMPFANVNVGDYEGYAVNYQGAPAPTLTVGTNLNAIGGTCVSLSNALPIKVCPALEFNCGNGSYTGTFIANGITGQAGTLYVTVLNALPVSTTLTVTGSGFAGSKTEVLTTGQDTVAIPVTFDGSGSGGVMAVTVSGLQSSGTCSINVTTLAPPPPTPFSFTCASATLDGRFVQNNAIQTGSVTLQLTGVTVGGTTNFVISGTNFSGGLQNVELKAGQTSIAIPIEYNGAAPDGNYNVSITSPHGTNTCSVVVPVVSAMDIQYAFDCLGSRVKGNFIANGIAGQTGTISIPVSIIGSSSTTFTVTGAGFTGTFTGTLDGNTTSVVIPITYNGTGTEGSRVLTITSPNGAGNCTATAIVKAACKAEGGRIGR
ncbi:MAG: hypothetical protein RLZZ628_67 [Bacteroidota bacterium]|jgi:hypothetical protein